VEPARLTRFPRGLTARRKSLDPGHAGAIKGFAVAVIDIARQRSDLPSRFESKTA
jgi:hypothetical protein